MMKFVSDLPALPDKAGARAFREWCDELHRRVVVDLILMDLDRTLADAEKQQEEARAGLGHA